MSPKYPREDLVDEKDSSVGSKWSTIPGRSLKDIPTAYNRQLKFRWEPELLCEPGGSKGYERPEERNNNNNENGGGRKNPKQHNQATKKKKEKEERKKKKK